jgi:hypothetical protein
MNYPARHGIFQVSLKFEFGALAAFLERVQGRFGLVRVGIE